jgi:H+/Cl- antiporter ClcA
LAQAGGEINIRSRPFYGLLVLSALFGTMAALLTVGFALVYKYGLQVMWQTLPASLGLSSGTSTPLFIVVVCLMGGLLVGLITWYSKVHPQLLVEEFEEFTTEGRIAPRGGFVGMFRGLIGLIFGGSIGPEGPMTAGSGALGTLVAERRGMKRPVTAVATYASISGMFGSFLSSPFGMAILTIEGGMEKGKLSWKLLIPGIVASSVGYVIFFIITGYAFGGMYQFPPYEGPKVIDIFYAVGLGFLGGLVGLLFIGLFRAMRGAVRPVRSRPIELALLAGLVLGLVGAAFPLTLFSGDAEIQPLINGAVEMGVVTLVILGLLKVFLTVTCLALGWSGGYIFPSFFAGAALGLAVHLLLPFIPELLCMTCVISGLSVTLLKSPIAMTFIVQALFDPHLAAMIAIAVVLAFLLTYHIDLIPKASEPKADQGAKTGGKGPS